MPSPIPRPSSGSGRSRDARRLRGWRAALVGLALGPLAGCNGSVRVLPGPAPIPAPPPPPVHFELEPNDRAADANFVGALAGGQRFSVRGELWAPLGDVDGFAFVSSEPLALDFVLDASDPHADLDLCVYDPWRDEIVACFEAPFDDKGRILVLESQRDFHLIVYSAYLDCGSPYRLELRCTPLAPGTAAGPDALAPELPAARLRGLDPPPALRDYPRERARGVVPAGERRPWAHGVRFTQDAGGRLLEARPVLILGP